MGTKSAGDQTTTMQLDPTSQAYMKEVYQRSLAAASQPYTPYTGQTVASASDLAMPAVQNWQGAANYGNLGLAAMGGNTAAVQQMMNPYLSTMGPVWDQARQGAINAVKGQFTTPGGGAYGGSRQGVAEGAALAGIANQQAQQTYGAFNDAMGQANALAQMGLGANQNLFGAGDYFRNIQQQYLTSQQNQFNEARDWDARNLALLRNAGPTGQTTTTPMSWDPFGSLIGLGLTAASLA